MEINKDFFIDMKSTKEEIEAKEKEIAEKIETLLRNGNSISDVLKVEAFFLKAENTGKDSSLWKVEVTLKGRQFFLDGQSTKLKNKIVTYSEGKASIDGIGFIDDSTISFYVSICEEESPPVPPKNADRIWNVANEKSSKVKYFCSPGYNNTIGSDIVHSTCYNGKWDYIHKRIRCEKVKCNITELPTPPNYGKHNATIEDENTLVFEQKVLYLCKSHFMPNISDKIEAVCNKNANWSPIIEYECISDDYEKTYIEYKRNEQEWLSKPQYKKLPFNIFNFDSTDKGNWFYYVTVPSLAGLTLLVCCCLCCTSTESPLYLLCHEEPKK